jgi:hypothetical protein
MKIFTDKQGYIRNWIYVVLVTIQLVVFFAAAYMTGASSCLKK